MIRPNVYALLSVLSLTLGGSAFAQDAPRVPTAPNPTAPNPTAPDPVLSNSVPLNLVERMFGAGTEISLGALPEDFPLALNLPKGVSVDLVTQNDWSGERYYSLYLTSEQPSERAARNLAKNLLGLGFEPASSWQHWGFSYTSAVTTSQEFCGEGFYAVLETTDTFELALNLSSHEGRYPNGCDSYDSSAYGEPPVPSLTPPEGVEVIRIEPGYTFDSQSSSVALEPALATEAALSHYGAQLEAAGWLQVDDGGDAVMRWSQWLGQRDGETWYLVMTFIGEKIYPGQTYGVVIASAVFEDIPVPAGLVAPEVE